MTGIRKVRFNDVTIENGVVYAKTEEQRQQDQREMSRRQWLKYVSLITSGYPAMKAFIMAKQGK